MSMRFDERRAAIPRLHFVERRASPPSPPRSGSAARRFGARS